MIDEFNQIIEFFKEIDILRNKFFDELEKKISDK